MRVDAAFEFIQKLGVPCAPPHHHHTKHRRPLAHDVCTAGDECYASEVACAHAQPTAPLGTTPSTTLTSPRRAPPSARHVLCPRLRPRTPRVWPASKHTQKTRASSVLEYLASTLTFARPSPSRAQSEKNLHAVCDHALEQQNATGIKLLWATQNLFSHPRFMNGGATNPNLDNYAWRAFPTPHTHSARRAPAACATACNFKHALL